MADENINPNEEEQQLEEQEEETSQPDVQNEQPAEEQVEEPQQEEEQEEAPEEERPPSRREQLRVQQLLKKYGPPQQRQQAPQPEGPNYREMLDAPDEVYEQLESTQQQYGQAQYQQGQNAALQQMQTVEWRTTLHIDTPEVQREYDMLNPTSQNFHPALTDTINQLYLKTVGYDEKSGVVQNSGIRYKEFVDSYMELADEMAKSKVAKTTKNIAQQAANTGLRPDGSSAKRLNLNQPIENMSDEELAAYGKKLGLAPQ